jgi:hypothetical protein
VVGVLPRVPGLMDGAVDAGQCAPSSGPRPASTACRTASAEEEREGWVVSQGAPRGLGCRLVQQMIGSREGAPGCEAVAIAAVLGES